MKKLTEGEIYWMGYDKGVLASIQTFKKSIRGGIIGDETPQAMIRRLRDNVIPNLQKLLSTKDDSHEKH